MLTERLVHFTGPEPSGYDIDRGGNRIPIYRWGAATIKRAETSLGAVSMTYRFPGTVTVKADTPGEFWKVAGPVLGMVGLALLILL